MGPPRGTSHTASTASLGRKQAQAERPSAGAPTCVAEVYELLGQEVGEELHDEQQVLVLLLLLRGGVGPLPPHVVPGVHAQQGEARLVQVHGFGLGKSRQRSGCWGSLAGEHKHYRSPRCNPINLL